MLIDVGATGLQRQPYFFKKSNKILIERIPFLFLVYEREYEQTLFLDRKK